ncbi:MAG: prolyl oligopeptidase family serine peptidase [Phycisphaeraceae bacterium]|nr:prolyl oligopeptidase family serine peptidase [Phycisphaeraceae bacterium]
MDEFSRRIDGRAWPLCPRFRLSKQLALVLTCMGLFLAPALRAETPQPGEDRSNATEGKRIEQARPVYRSIRAVSQIRQARMFGPSLLHEGPTVFRVEIPSRFARDFHAGRIEWPRIAIHDPLEDKTDHAVVVDPPRLMPMQPGRDAPPLVLTLRGPEYQGPDRTLQATLEPFQAADGHDGVTLPPIESNEWTIQLIGRQFESVHKDHRDELAVWLQDHNQARPIWNHIPQWPAIETALSRPEHPYHHLRGFMIRAYHNPQLRRLTPYTVYVPESLDLEEPVPLMILLHGSGGDHRNLVADYAAGQRFDKHPMLIANAGAFHQQEFRHMALNNVRWVIEDMKKKYNVDPSRIYLQGISLGGRGTLEAASLMPDVFAAISAQGIYGAIGTFNDPVAVLNRDPFALAMDARADIRGVLPNLSSTAVELVYGWKDDSTPPLHAQKVIAALKLAMVNVRDSGFDTGHNISIPDYDWADTRRWFLEHRKPEHPPEVRLRVGNLRFNRHAWVQVHGLSRYDRMGDVHAFRLSRDPDVLEVRATGILAATFDPPFEVRRIRVPGNPPISVEPGKAIHLIWDEDGRVERVDELPERIVSRTSKRPGVGGPMWDIFSEPVLFVYEDHHPALRASADAGARWDMTWGDQRLPVLAADEVTEELRATHNLVIYTRPEPRADWLRAAARPYPLLGATERDEDSNRDRPGEAETEGGAANGMNPSVLRDAIRRPQWRDANIRMAIAPSPWSANHSVLWIESESPRPWRLVELGWWDRWGHADWLIAEARLDPRGRGAGGMNILGGGSFDHHWRPQSEMNGDFRPDTNRLIHIDSRVRRMREQLQGLDEE